MTSLPPVPPSAAAPSPSSVPISVSGEMDLGEMVRQAVARARLQTELEKEKASLSASSTPVLPLRDWFPSRVKIEDATSHSLIPWEWWPIHEEMCNDAETQPLLVWLKARQVSGSWFWAGRAVYGANYHPIFRVLLLSQGEDEATELLEKCRCIWRYLPVEEQQPILKDNATEITFANGSTIMALPATKRAGRGYTASLIIVDEAAFHPYAAENYAAYKPTIDAGGQLVVVSTANGAGGFFHTLYTEAKAGLNGFTARFYSWRSRPGRDEAWYERQRAQYRSTPGLLDQEYPADDLSAFLLSGNMRFDTAAVQYGRTLSLSPAVEPIPSHLAARSSSITPELLRLLDLSSLRIWSLPLPGRSYVLGSDVAEGIAGRADFSCTQVLDARTLEHVASLHGKWEPGVFAQLSALLAWFYNAGLWGIERNNHGHTVLYVADQELRYPRLYWHMDTVAQTDVSRNLTARAWRPEPARRLGFPTTTGTKPGLIDDLADVISSYSLRSYDTLFWDECQTYIVTERGGFEASPGSHDDRVMAMAIARRMAMQPGAVAGNGSHSGPPSSASPSQSQSNVIVQSGFTDLDDDGNVIAVKVNVRSRSSSSSQLGWRY